MQMMIRMAGRMQHHQARNRVRGIPAVFRPKGRIVILPDPVAHQPIMLDIVRQQKLHLCMGRQHQPNDQPHQPEQCSDQHRPSQRPAQIDHIRIAPGLRLALAQTTFHLVASHKLARPGAAQECIEPLACGGGIRIIRGGDEPVVHQPVGRGMMAVEKRDIDRHPQAKRQPRGLVDQFMCDRVCHLPEPQTKSQKTEHPAPKAQPRAPGQGKKRKSQHKKVRDPQPKHQPVSPKVSPQGPVLHQPVGQAVGGSDHQRHAQKPAKGPAAAHPCPDRQTQRRTQACRRKPPGRMAEIYMLEGRQINHGATRGGKRFICRDPASCHRRKRGDYRRSISASVFFRGFLSRWRRPMASGVSFPRRRDR